MKTYHHHDHKLPVLEDNESSLGPKLQLHFYFYLEESDQPLSATYFDHVGILLQMGMTDLELDVDAKKKVIAPFEVSHSRLTAVNVKSIYGYEFERIGNMTDCKFTIGTKRVQSKDRGNLIYLELDD